MPLIAPSMRGAVLFGRERLQAARCRELHVDGNAVGVKAGLVDQLGIGIGNGLEVDIAAKLVVFAQGARHLDDLLHRVIGRADDAGREEQALDIVALVECQGELDDLLSGEARAADVRALAVDAIMAVENAAVGEQIFRSEMQRPSGA
jgi:hypothetical protein